MRSPRLVRLLLPCAFAMLLGGLRASAQGGAIDGASGAASERAPAAASERAARRALCEDLRAFAARELADKRIPALALALVDVDAATGDSWSWSTALGEWGEPGGATERTDVDAVWRVASIGKIVTALAVMALVERGELELDERVQHYLPSFRPRDERAAEITLRHLLRHQSGLGRECPIGNWYDASLPGLEATVRSLDGTDLLFAPGTATRYSNPGYAVLGRVLEVGAGRPFAAAVDDLVLRPLGMRDSAFAERPDLAARTVRGRMWTLDGRDIPTPGFAFGCGPATNLRSSTGDLLALARSWLPRAERTVVGAPSLAAMWQLGGEPPGEGLGFRVEPCAGGRRVGHAGTAPGTASELAALPDEGLAVAVAVGLDFANDVAAAIAARALQGMRELRRGNALSPPVWPEPLGVAAARAVAGRYVAGDEWFDLVERGGDLVFDPCIGIASVQRRAGELWVADDACALGTRTLRPDGRDRVFDGYSYFRRRPPDRLPPPAPADLLPLLGEYGWDHGGLVVYEDEGRLGVLLEWHVRELPDRIGTDRFEFPPGSFGGETLAFERDAAGAVVAAVLAGVRLPRRAEPTAGTFRIVPQAGIAELRARARAATPPQQPAGLRAPDLVLLAPLSPTLRFDVRYATADNFLGTPVYERAAPALQRPAAMALLEAERRLAALGYGLLVFDAYRPWSVTKIFWDATPPAQREFVADPGKGSRHNRGCAVDLTLCDLATGAPVPMPSGYDEFTVRAYPDWPGGTGRQRWHRELLRRTMEDCGFTVYEREWWHFDYRDWQRYPIGNDSEK